MAFRGPKLWICNLFCSIEDCLGKHSIQCLPHWGSGISWSAQDQDLSVPLSHDNKQHCSDKNLLFTHGMCWLQIGCGSILGHVLGQLKLCSSCLFILEFRLKKQTQSGTCHSWKFEPQNSSSSFCMDRSMSFSLTFRWLNEITGPCVMSVLQGITLLP